MTEPTGAEERPQPTDERPPVPPVPPFSAQQPSPFQSPFAQPPVPPYPAFGTIPPAPLQGTRPSTGRWKGLAVALAVGLIIGGGLGAGTFAALSDPTESDEYQALAEQLEGERGQAVAAEEPATSSPSAATSSSAADDDESQFASVGQPVSNQGVTLTVTNALVSDSIELNETNYAPGSGFEEYTPTAPDAGGKFVVVQTHVVNNAQVSMDLTCGYPIATTVVDSQERQFDTIDSLYKLRGNPECNDQLQPGFEADMTYVYMVPANAQIVAFGFADATDFSNPSADYTGVRLNL